jgi:DNA-binding NarL/FixJ family response regulator
MVERKREQSDRPIRVIAVDDHGVVRDSLRLACERRGGLEFVGEAADGREAIRLILELNPDVVLLDVVMPGLDGYEVVRQIQQGGYEGRILILTSRDDPNAVFMASVLGVQGFLRKSATLDQVADAIERVGSGGRVFGFDEERQAIAQLGQMAKRARRIADVASSLTLREHQALELLAEGLSTRQIASQLGIMERTAESHISSVYRKLDVGTRVQAVRRASSLGLLDSRVLE